MFVLSYKSKSLLDMGLLQKKLTNSSSNNDDNNNNKFHYKMAQEKLEYVLKESKSFHFKYQQRRRAFIKTMERILHYYIYSPGTESHNAKDDDEYKY